MRYILDLFAYAALGYLIGYFLSEGFLYHNQHQECQKHKNEYIEDESIPRIKG